MADSATKVSVDTATPQAEAGHRNWYVVLHLVDGKAEPQPDWRNHMRVGDHVTFVSPDGTVDVNFTPIAAKDLEGNDVDGLYPFGKANIRITGDCQAHRVIHSCKARMTCRIIDEDKVVHTYDGPVSNYKLGDDDDSDGGTNVCTGGTGTTQVKCP
jgi:hypothetical protein